MRICIEERVLSKYPTVEIGYLIADVVIQKTNPAVELLKQDLVKTLDTMGLSALNYTLHPRIAAWRKVYSEDFLIKPVLPSSLEALLKRVLKGKALWNICNVVDLYNCCSILSLFPMGGYDLSKISGDIELRYAQEGESFQGIGEKTAVPMQPHHIVYADEHKVLCWLWNYKDSLESCIDMQTKRVLFFIDSLHAQEAASMQNALLQLESLLKKIGSVPLVQGILNQNMPQAYVEVL